MIRWAWFVALALALGYTAEAKVVAKRAKPPSRTQLRAPSPVTITVGDSKLLVEIADNDSLRQQGLSGRKSMAWNSGMLFVFPAPDSRTFWMIDCLFDLDIAYLDSKGIVRDVQTMVIEPGVSPERLSRYPSATSDIVYALEVNRGWMKSSGLNVGDRIPAVTGFRTRQ